jgi:hypothetical protein
MLNGEGSHGSQGRMIEGLVGKVMGLYGSSI